MPPQPKTSDQARQQAVLLRLREDKRHADAALLPQQTADDRQSQLMASDVKTAAPAYLRKLGAHPDVTPAPWDSASRASGTAAPLYLRKTAADFSCADPVFGARADAGVSAPDARLALSQGA